MGEAAEVDKECWLRHSRVMGATHPETLKAMRSHAISLGKTGNNHEASEIFMQCWRLQEHFSGKDHPDTLNVMRAYSITLEKQGHLDVAAELAFHAWKYSLAKLGESHVETGRAMTELQKRIDSLSAPTSPAQSVTHAEQLKRRIDQLKHEHG